MASVFYEEAYLDQLISDSLNDIAELRNTTYFDDISLKMTKWKDFMHDLRTRSEEFKINMKEKYEAIKNSAKERANISRSTTQVLTYNPPAHPVTADYIAPVSLPPLAPVSYQQPRITVSVPRTKLYVFLNNDFKEVFIELRKINANFEYVYWTECMEIPRNAWLLYLEDVVTRLDDEGLPQKIKRFASKWENRFVFVPLYKEGGDALTNFRNNIYEDTYLPGISVAKGIYRLRVCDNGIDRTSSKEIIDSSELRSTLLNIQSPK